MADPIDHRYNAAGQPVPVYSQASPGFGGAIMDAIKALVGATAPRSIVQRKANIDQQVSQADPSSGSLGNQF